MTFTSTAAVVEHLGARVVLADCEPQSLNLDPAQVARRLTPRTKAILPVHFAGQACDMDALCDLARPRGLAVIEDAAHALPTQYRGRRVGTIGDATCFSFYVTKTVTTGEGGMVTTDRDDLAERVRVMRLHGMNRDAWKRYAKGGSWRYDIQDAGYKYNLTDIAASIGIHQLRRSDGFHARRLEMARAYDRLLAGVPGVRLPQVAEPEAHAWHLYVIQVDPGELRIGRDDFIGELASREIGVSVHFIPLHLHSHYRDRYGLRPEDYPVATQAFDRILSLPLYPKMTDQDLSRVAGAVRDIAEAHRR